MAESPPDEVTELLRAWNNGEIAEILHVSPETVMRDWRMAKAWLRRALSRRGADDP